MITPATGGAVGEASAARSANGHEHGGVPQATGPVALARWNICNNVCINIPNQTAAESSFILFKITDCKKSVVFPSK